MIETIKAVVFAISNLFTSFSNSPADPAFDAEINGVLLLGVFIFIAVAYTKYKYKADYYDEED